MSKEQVTSNSDIKITIGLDDEKVPVHMEWQAEGNPNGPTAQECKAMLLAIFDAENRETLKIDLWTKEMQVNEMDRFFYQTLRSMADTYFRATNNQKLASNFQRFVQFFGEETEILPKSTS